MNLWQALILGIIQGLTEFLPISSSGHLKASREVLGFQELGLTFDVFLHLATLLAVLIYFRHDLRRLVTEGELSRVVSRLVLATVPVFAAGYLLESHLENLSGWAVVGGWTFSGAYLLLTRRERGHGRHAECPIPRIILIGLAQCFALLPGVSRSGSTISAGIWLGLDRTEAARFSFLLAIPAILGAGAYKGLKLLQSENPYENFNTFLAVGMLASFVVGLGAIHALMAIVRQNVFHLFGWYNFLAAAAFAVYLWVS